MCTFSADYNLFSFEGVFAPHQLEDNKASARARHLADGTHPEIPVQISSPSAMPLGQLFTLPKRLFVRVIVAAHDSSGLRVFVGLVVEGLQAAVVHILELGQRVLDELRSDRRRYASQE